MIPYNIQTTGRLVQVICNNKVVHTGTFESAEHFVDTHQIIGQVSGVPVTRAELSKCFDKVKNTDNWKNPINTLLPCEDTSINRELYAKTIEFFTGSITNFEVDEKGTWIHAAGYYAVCGA